MGAISSSEAWTINAVAAASVIAGFFAAMLGKEAIAYAFCVLAAALGCFVLVAA